MISRVRIEAMGASAAAVEESLVNAAESLDQNLFTKAALRGEQVIERQVEGPPGRTEFRGRLLLYPVSERLEPTGIQFAQNSGTVRMWATDSGTT